MPNDADWTRAVRKLIRMTEDGKLSWTDTFFQTTIRDNVVGNRIFGASVDNHWVIVYEYRYKTYRDEDVWEWDDDVSIEFVDIQGNLEWTWPKSAYRYQLIDAIRCRVSGAHVFLEGFLKDEPPSA